jgi:hypothetical protein
MIFHNNDLLLRIAAIAGILGTSTYKLHELKYFYDLSAPVHSAFVV